MKLSDAISVGAKLRPQGTGAYYDAETHATCAMGAALEAVGVDITALDMVVLWGKCGRLWSWARAKQHECPVGDCGSITSAMGIITHLNDRPHCWTRERIAAWVAVVEPQDGQPCATVPQETLEAVPAQPHGRT